MPKLLACILLSYTIAQSATAQAVTDSISGRSLSPAVEVYYQSLGDEAPIYNGPEYIEYPFLIQKGYPYFMSAFVNGTIYFDGMVFGNIPMLYDLVNDQLVIHHFHNLYQISLPSEKVQQFVLGEHKFIRFVYNEHNRLKTGFYEEVYTGKVALYIKREKSITETVRPEGVEREVFNRDSYFILKDGMYYNVRNQEGMFDLFQSRKREIQRYLKGNHVKFRKDPEKTMILATRLFDQLTS